MDVYLCKPYLFRSLLRNRDNYDVFAPNEMLRLFITHNIDYETVVDYFNEMIIRGLIGRNNTALKPCNPHRLCVYAKYGYLDKHAIMYVDSLNGISKVTLRQIAADNPNLTFDAMQYIYSCGIRLFHWVYWCILSDEQKTLLSDASYINRDKTLPCDYICSLHMPTSAKVRDYMLTIWDMDDTIHMNQFLNFDDIIILASHAQSRNVCMKLIDCISREIAFTRQQFLDLYAIIKERDFYDDLASANDVHARDNFIGAMKDIAYWIGVNCVDEFEIHGVLLPNYMKGCISNGYTNTDKKVEWLKHKITSFVNDDDLHNIDHELWGVEVHHSVAIGFTKALPNNNDDIRTVWKHVNIKFPLTYEHHDPIMNEANAPIIDKRNRYAADVFALIVMMCDDFITLR